MSKKKADAIHVLLGALGGAGTGAAAGALGGGFGAIPGALLGGVAGALGVNQIEGGPPKNPALNQAGWDIATAGAGGLLGSSAAKMAGPMVANSPKVAQALKYGLPAAGGFIGGKIAAGVQGGKGKAAAAADPNNPDAAKQLFADALAHGMSPRGAAQTLLYSQMATSKDPARAFLAESFGPPQELLRLRANRQLQALGIDKDVLENQANNEQANITDRENYLVNQTSDPQTIALFHQLADLRRQKAQSLPERLLQASLGAQTKDNSADSFIQSLATTQARYGGGQSYQAPGVDTSGTQAPQFDPVTGERIG